MTDPPGPTPPGPTPYGPTLPGPGPDRAAWLQAVIDASPSMTLVIDADGVVRFASGASAAMTGLPPDAAVGMSILDTIHPDDLVPLATSLEFTLANPGQRRPLAFRYRRADGTWGTAEAHAHNLLGSPPVDGIVASVHDITHRALLDEVLGSVMRGGELDKSAAAVAGFVAELIDGNAVHVLYDSGSDMRGESASPEMPDALRPRSLGDAAASPLWSDTVESGRPRTVLAGEPSASVDPLASAMAAAGAQAFWVRPIKLPVTGQVAGLLTVLVDLPLPPSPSQEQGLRKACELMGFALDRWRYEQLLLSAARTDALTGLPNRSQFFSHLRAELTRIHPSMAADARTTAVLYADLDGFKPVNDTLGHAAGDAVLQIVARRLEQGVRPTDVVARLGGDEFAIVCPGVGDPHEAGMVAQRLVDAVAAPMRVDGADVTVGLSIGVALTRPGPGSDIDGIVRAADAALLSAKAAGKGRVAFAPAG